MSYTSTEERDWLQRAHSVGHNLPSHFRPFIVRCERTSFFASGLCDIPIRLRAPANENQP